MSKPPFQSLSDRILHVIVAELGEYERTGSPVLEGAVAAVHARVMIEMEPIRAALKELALAAAYCAQHRAYRNEVQPLPPLGWPDYTPEIRRIDIGPTDDAATAQRAIDGARPVLESFGLHLRQPPHQP